MAKSLVSGILVVFLQLEVGVPDTGTRYRYPCPSQHTASVSMCLLGC